MAKVLKQRKSREDGERVWADWVEKMVRWKRGGSSRADKT